MHTVVLRGYDKDGRPHEASFTVNVWRPGANLGIYLSAIGALCLLLAGGLALVRLLRGARAS